MATRRAGPSSNINSRLRSQASQPTKSKPAQRHVSVVDELPEATASVPSGPLSPSNKSTRVGDQKLSESNVQVVVRLRGRSQKEIDEGSPLIATTKGARGDEVTIETALPTTTLGVFNSPPTRTYPFDKVFGAEADQAMVYNDVVAPILDEVVSGYNCTIFAYGQTGTGKTHTMQGDLTPTITGAPGPDAGMIPRVLAKLYHYLETHVADYSVRVSFIELYNEELRDLLAPEFSAPSNSTQPMDRAGGGSATAGLKIFDEAGTGKRGVTIQGLEEVPAKDAKAAIALLCKGSHRRQIAATKFNEHSSRSHSVFTITVHTKETTKGDDTLRVGKLNLVDLAGSENIGRSGAENKRAREAGMINQSLLTLGRVINALVEKSPHVPYRESKLTRLLQDSLGGRTKTCIIATISPARSNMEETLSTLDYAIRAKTIRNKPELNQRMTRNGLLKEYVGEIERLKADLLAAREKNGIYFSKESWDELSHEQELAKTAALESKSLVERLEMALTRKREEFEDFLTLFTKRERELEEAQETLKVTSAELVKTETELDGTKVALQEETIMREAHAQSEMALDEVALGLRNVVKKSLNDVAGLFDKLDRKASVFDSNSGVVILHGSQILSQMEELEKKLGEYTSHHAGITERLDQQTKLLESPDVAVLHSQVAFIQERMAQLSKFVQRVRSLDNDSSCAMEDLDTAVRDATKTILDNFKSWEEELSSSCRAFVGQVTAACASEISNAVGAIKAASELVDGIVRDTLDFVDAERRNVSDMQNMATAAAATEVQRLQLRNSLLENMLNSERQKTQETRDALVADVSALLVGFTDERDRSLRKAVSVVKTDIEESQKSMQEFSQGFGTRSSSAISAIGEVEKGLDTKRGKNKRLRDDGLQSLNNLTQAIDAGITAMADGVEQHASTELEHIRELSNRLETTYSESSERLGRHKRARLETFSALEADVREGYGHLEGAVASSSAMVERASKQLAVDTRTLRTYTETHHIQTSSFLASIGSRAHELLSQGTRSDVSTGTTPRKRQWDYVDKWQLTKGRNDVLRDRKPNRSSTVPQRPSSLRVDDSDEVVEEMPLDALTPDVAEAHEPVSDHDATSVRVDEETEAIQPLDSPSSSSALSLSASTTPSNSTAETSKSTHSAAIPPPAVTMPPPKPAGYLRNRTGGGTIPSGGRRTTKAAASSKIPERPSNAPRGSLAENVAPLRRRLR